MPPDGRLELRLADLSHAELLRVAAIGCGESRAAMAEANRMLSAEKPLPAWAVDQVLLSPDLLPKLLSVCISWNKGGAPMISDRLQDRAASAVCRAWRAAWARQLDVERICRVLGTLCDGLEFMSPTGGAALSDVSFCVASHSLDGSTLDIVTRPRVVPGSAWPKRPAGPDRLMQAAADPEEWPFVLLCDGQHLYVTDNRRHRISKRSLQGIEVGSAHAVHTPCTSRAQVMHMRMHMRMQVSFATLPDVLEHAAGAIHLAIGKDSEGRDELFVSQVEVVRSQ